MRSLSLILLLVAPALLPADEKLAGIACRSVHLGYTAGEATAFSTEAIVDHSAPGTYFCAIGWNKGYFGIQELGNGKKLAIFSVWDSGQNDPKAVDESKRVKLIHKDEKTRIGRFGGEGTGGQSFLDFEWKAGTPYRFLVTSKPNGERTEYAGHLYRPETKSWTHMVTFSTITGGKNLGSFYSFVEDFKRDKVSLTNTRSARFGDAWLRPLQGDWQPVNKARFTADSNPATNINAGLKDHLFFLATGGDTKNTDTKLRDSITLAEGKRTLPESLRSVAAAPASNPTLFVSAFEPQGAIHAYTLDMKTGRLDKRAKTSGVEHPFFLALSPDRKFLYSIHAKNFGGKDKEQVAAYAVSPDGGLKFLNRQSAEGAAACYLDVDATGKSVLVANYSSGSVASLPVKADGSLGEPASFHQHKGTSVNPQRQKEPHAHCIVVSPDNRFAFAADLGLDQILCYKLDPKTAKLTPNDPPFAKSPPGAGPRHLTFHPNGKRVYAINELLNSVTVFEYDAVKGTLRDTQTISTLPDDFKGTSYCADLKITADGKHLYGTNRGHDSIACYSIADDGRLTRIGIEPSLGKGPQNLAIVGEWLVCANMPGNNLAVFRIDAASGKLKSTGDPVTHASPSCIMVLPGK